MNTRNTLSLAMRIYMLFAFVFGFTNSNAQTITINATGTVGSFKTGAVNTAGTKLDGNMVNISTTAGNNRGWAVFDLSAIPAGATITAVDVIFTTFGSALSTATNSIRGFTGNPATIPGATLFAQINTGTLLNSSSWAAAATITAPVTAGGLGFFQANVGNANVIIGFVRGSTNTYNIFGYPGTAAQQPKLQISYLLPCTGMPNAGTIIDAPVSICPGTNFTMSLSGHTAGGGMSYQWQSRPIAGTFSNIIGATATSLTTNTTIPREYRCIVTCTNSAQTAITPVVTVGINNFYVCYCKAGLGGSTTASIDSVIITGTTLRNGSPGTAPSFYTQYQPVVPATASLQAGGLYTLTVKYGSSATGSLWIDANQNNVFEASEWTRINVNAVTGEVVFQVPPTALSGLTGMRIRSADPAATNGAANACSNIASGEVEDYVINITPAPVNDIKLQAILSPLNKLDFCPYKAIPARVVVYNNGSAPQTNFVVNTMLSGPSTSIFNSFAYTGTLAPFRSDTLSITNYTLMFTGTYNVTANTILTGDAIPNNDTIKVSFNLLGSANVPVGRVDSVCIGEEAMLHVLPDGYKHNWYMAPAYGSKVFVGDTLRITNMQKDTIFYVCSEPSTASVGSLTTTTVAGNGCGGGAMFNIVPNVNLSVDSFAALFGSTGNQTVNVYYRLGSFAGNETNASAWTLLGTTNVNATSTTSLTNFKVNGSLPLAVGNTYGIYINYDASYTNGTTTFTNADMSIQTGTGLCNPFANTNPGRMFNGTVFYNKGPVLCESPIVSVTAYVGPAPVANLGKDIVGCEDEDIILDAGHFGANYVWSTQQFTQTISVKNAPGIYWVEVDKYCKSSDTVEVFLNPKPETSGISYQRNINSYIFTAGGVKHANVIRWLFGDGSSALGATVQHEYLTAGNYQVLLILENDCGADTTALTLPLGISTIGVDEKFVLYPNPGNSSITIEYDDMPANADINIVNTLGAVVLQQKATNAKKQQIDISSLPVGNYILKLQTDKAAINKPFVVSR